MPLKLYAWTHQHFFLYMTQIAASMAGVEVEVVVPTDEMKEDKDFIAKKGAMNYPILELEDGKWLGEHIAICRFLLELGGKTEMLGKTPFQAAQIEQWSHYQSQTLGKHWLTVMMTSFGYKEDKAAWEMAIDTFSSELPLVEATLAKTGFLVGDSMTVADILFFRISLALFNFLLGAEQRAEMPAFTAWYEKMSRHPAVVGVVGKYHMTAEPMKLCGSSKVVTFGDAKKEVKAEEEEDDDMDLFGSEDEEEQIERLTKIAKIAQDAKAAAGKVAKTVIAKSNILFEVKPFDSETDLDAVAAKILSEIVMDGLLWKTETKKEPVAFGIYKLIIGCTVEDEKVSCDDLQEQIEAYEDLVQSVDIASFMKV